MVPEIDGVRYEVGEATVTIAAAATGPASPSAEGSDSLADSGGNEK